MKRVLIGALTAFLIGACASDEGPDSTMAGSVDRSELADSRVPAWAADMIWYQIFPERFHNGDPANDPPRTSLPNPDDVPESWEHTRWTSDWYERQPWEEEKHPSHFWTVRDRRYGGDLQGVIDKLDYLEELGINGIYFNPLFWARSEHKYDGNTYHHIDPWFGPNPEADFAQMARETSDPATWGMTSADSLFFVMVDQAHERGIRVIIDGVFNHSGQEFFAFQDLYENQKESAYVDWYTVLEWDDPATSENEFDWQGWWDVRSLPEFADNAAGTNLHEGPKAYVFDATRKWMDPNGDGDPSDGVDGWRLDVVADVPNGFWADWNELVRELNPDAYTVAELWDDASTTVVEGGFSAVMNYYGFAFPVKGFLIDGRMPATAFAEALTDRLDAHRPAVAYALQNLIDSHDTDRVASMIVGASRNLPYQRDDWEIWYDYDWGATVSASEPEYPVRAPTAEEREIQRMVALFQMTFVGSPMVYYGTEAGMWGADDPDDRQPMWWPDMAFDPVAHHPATGPIDPIPVGFEADIYQFYQDVIGLRRSHPALRTGTLDVLAADDEKASVAYLRQLEEESLLIALNRSPEAQTLLLSPEALELEAGMGLYPIFSTGDTAVVGPDGDQIALSIPPQTGVVLQRTGVE